MLEDNRRLQEESKQCDKLEMNERRKQTDPYFSGSHAKMTRSDLLTGDIDPSVDYQYILDFFSEKQKRDDDCQTHNETGVLSPRKTVYDYGRQETKSPTSKYQRGLKRDLSILTVIFCSHKPKGAKGCQQDCDFRRKEPTPTSEVKQSLQRVRAGFSNPQSIKTAVLIFAFTNP